MNDEMVVSVLLVDDNEADFALTARLAAKLRSPRVRLDWVDGFKKALDAIRSGEYQVYLVDYHLRDGNGLDLLREAARLGCRAPMILLTGHGDLTVDMEAMSLGAADYLLKDGLQPSELERTIRYALNHARQHEELENANRRKEKAIDDLRQAQEHLVRQERSHAIGQMAAGIAHDLHNTLSLVLGYSDKLLEQAEGWSDRGPEVHRLRLINGAAADAVGVLHRLREFYRPRTEGEDLEPVQLQRVAQRAILLTRPRWKDQPQAGGHTIELKTDMAVVPEVSGNASELTELMTNLIFNAVDAMPSGGTISVRTRLETRRIKGPDGAGDGRNQDGVVLEVADTGMGMTPEVRRHCLQPFYTTKGASGSGLGLATTAGIVSRHNGVLDIESQQSKGTCVRVWLPAAETKSAPRRPPRRSPSGPKPRDFSTGARGHVVSGPGLSPPEKSTLRVLLVDDDEDVLSLVAELVRDGGHSVVTAQDSAQAIDLFVPGGFDLVVTDQSMPGACGMDLAAAIKLRDPDVTVVLLTGFGDMMSAQADCPEGVMAILSKPVRVTDLRQLLGKITPRQQPTV